MKHNHITYFSKLLIFLILIYLGLMSATVSHAENYKFVAQWPCTGEEKGNFSMPSSIATDISGNIYVVDSGNHRIQKFDNNGEFITSWGLYGSENGSFYWPSSVAVDSSGDVYIADSANYRVQKFDSNGEFITSWGSYGSGNESFYWPSSVAVDSFDNVYVVDEYNGIKKFDSNGEFITNWSSSGSEDESLHWPTSIAIDSSNNVYVADNGMNCIQKFSPSGNFITQWGSYGSENGNFSWMINGIAVDSAGNVYVADSENNRIQKFDSNGEFISTWGSYGSQNGNFESPGGIAVSPSNVIYVADNGNSRIQKFDSYGEFLSTWGSYGSTIGLPSGIAIGSSDDIYVVEGDSHRIQKFDSKGNSITKWGSYGSENGKFESPSGVALDSSGNVYIADSGNARIQKFDRNGEFISTWGNAGPENASLSWPFSIAVDSSGDVYVADSYNNCIKKFGSNGNFINTWGSGGSENGSFSQPSGVAVDSSDNVYVADSGNNRIQKFDSNGNFISAWGSYGPEDGNFSNPYGIAIDSSDNIYVADSGNNRIQKFDSYGGFIVSWGVYGSENGSFYWPNGVAVDSSGNVYVADNGNNRIQKFSLENSTPADAVPEIIWNTPSDIISGTPLNSTHLSAVALDPVSRSPIPGNFTYIPEIGTVLSAGTHTLYSYFTPENNENYTNASATVIINVINVIEQQEATPVANFSSNVYSGHVPLKVQFTDLSENANKWNWDFGDGTNSTEQNPSHTYSTAGNYAVILTVSNSNSTSSSNSLITVQAVEPVLNPGNGHYYALIIVPGGITWEDAKNAAQSLSYSGMKGHLATITSQDENDFIVGKLDLTYNWVGGSQSDGSEEPAGGWQWITGEPWSYTNWHSDEPNNYGDRENKLHIRGNGLWNDESNNSLQDGYIVEYEITNITVSVPPVSNFSSNVSMGNVPLTVQFIDLSQNAYEWNWSFGDGSGSIEQNPTHIYSTPGNYTVTLIVNNSAGSNVMTKPDYIIASKHEDPIIWGIVPLTLQFKDLSENATSWKWYFGDGTNSTEQNPMHTYTKAGQYAVTVTVNNAAGSNTATYTGYISVVNSLEPPVAAFSASPTYGKLPLNVSFSDSSTGSPTSWKWYFGDGTNSTEQNPTHLYSKAGQYAVTLSVSNIAGSNSITKLNYISVGNSLKAPVTSFSVSVAP